MSDEKRTTMAPLLGELIEERKRAEADLADSREGVKAWQESVEMLERHLADLDKAISALTPVPSPPDESSPQGSETDAAEEDDDIVEPAPMSDFSRGAQDAIDNEPRKEGESAEYNQGFDATTESLEGPTPPTDTVPAVEIPEGFTRWEGGECPVPYGRIVDIICRDPDIRVGQTNEVFAHMIDWSNAGDPAYNIIAYRIISQPAEEGEEGEPGNWTPASAYCDGYEGRTPIAPNNPDYFGEWLRGDQARLTVLSAQVEQAHLQLGAQPQATSEQGDDLAKVLGHQAAMASIEREEKAKPRWSWLNSNPYPKKAGGVS